MAERDDSDVYPSSSQDSEFHLRGNEKTTPSLPDSSTSGHNTYTVPSPADVHNTGRADSLVHKLDERQRLARERREERERQNAAREAQWAEREERARQFYEKQLGERRKRLEEQREREEKRRAAVEEKRRQKLEEEKTRYEAVMRRTLERSQRSRPKTNRWSWGGTLTASASHTSDADRRSVSTMNLSKHTDPVMTKRLSSSSATLLNSPDRVMRRMPLSPWENTVVNRLQTPTHSYLARSRSAASLSGDAASCHPMSSLSFKSLQSRSTERPGRAGLSLERPIRAGYVGPDSGQRRKTTHNVPVDRKDKDYVRKSWSNLSYPTPTLTPAIIKRAPSPGAQRGRLSQPLSVRSTPKASQKPPTSKKSRSPPPPASLPLSPSNPSLVAGNLRPSRAASETPSTSPSPRMTPEGEKGKKKEEDEERAKREAQGSMMEEEEEEEGEEKDKKKEESGQSKSPAKAAAESTVPKAETTKEIVSSPPTARPSAGTTDPEEASRLLAEKRRQAREQREREEEERRQQEEAERRHREEMARRKAEEKAKREEEAQRLAEEKKRREEEERSLAEERVQKEREEAERLQRQKEEEEARQREESDRLRQERDKHFQKQEEERLERKKRLEEIMKRTRRSDQKSTAQRNGEVSQQQGQDSVNSAPGSPSVSVVAPQASDSSQHSDRNGHTNLGSPPPSAGHGSSSSSDAQLRENGVATETPAFEEVIEVPMATKLSRQDGDGAEVEEEEVAVAARKKTPLLAFRENGSSHNLNAAGDQSQADLLM